MRLVLTPGPGAWRRCIPAGSIAVALLAGAAAGVWHDRSVPTPVAAASAVAPAVDGLRPLQAELEQAGLTLRLAEARSQELERQIDALNQRLRECKEELTFFRHAGERKH